MSTYRLRRESQHQMLPKLELFALINGAEEYHPAAPENARGAAIC